MLWLRARASVVGQYLPADGVDLVLTAPALSQTQEELAFEYLATGWLLGREAAETLRLEPIFGCRRPSRGRRDDRTAQRHGLCGGRAEAGRIVRDPGRGWRAGAIARARAGRRGGRPGAGRRGAPRVGLLGRRGDAPPATALRRGSPAARRHAQPTAPRGGCRPPHLPRARGGHRSGRDVAALRSRRAGRARAGRGRRRARARLVRAATPACGRPRRGERRRIGPHRRRRAAR